MVWLLGFDRETVNPALVVPALPSETATSLMEMVGCASSLVIVPTPWLSVIVAFVGPDRFTLKVSVGSKVVSPLTVTLSGWDLSRRERHAPPGLCT